MKSYRGLESKITRHKRVIKEELALYTSLLAGIKNTYTSWEISPAISQDVKARELAPGTYIIENVILRA